MDKLRPGSSAPDFKKERKMLGQDGYDVGETGAAKTYGNVPQSAAMIFQKANGLSADGIAGPQMLGNLYASEVTADGEIGNTRGPVTSAPNGEPVTVTETPSFTTNPYDESNVVQQAEALLQQHNASAPTYSSKWQAQINEHLNKIMNRDPFSYNFNDDALYQQYKDIYTQMGLMAMMDTMGQASAMTGGYGNSYAQTVGQQAYNQQLSQLNNVLPELYQSAYDRYAYEGDQLYDQYGMLIDQENMDYGRYMDAYSRWADQRDYALEERKAAQETDPVYSAFTYEEQAKWDKEFQKATSLSAVDRIADRMEQAGIDPQIVAQWYEHYAAAFMEPGPGPEPKPSPTHKYGGSGGVGGFQTMIDHR